MCDENFDGGSLPRKTLSAISIAFAPEIRTSAIAPSPGGVEIAAMVSETVMIPNPNCRATAPVAKCVGDRIEKRRRAGALQTLATVRGSFSLAQQSVSCFLPLCPRKSGPIEAGHSL